MRIEQLVEFHKAAAFRPFRIHMADGRHLDVKHPEFLAYSPKVRIAIVMRLDGTFEIVDHLLVATLEVRNGAPRSRRKRK